MKLPAVVGLLAGAGAVVLLVIVSDPSQVWSTVRGVGWGILLLGLTHLGRVLLLTLAWRSLLVGEDCRPTLGELFRIRWIAAGANALTPFVLGDGEVLRGYLLTRRTDIDGSLSAAVVIVEIMARLLALLVFILVGLAILILSRWTVSWWALGWVAGAMAAMVGTFALAQRRDVLGTASRWMRRLPGGRGWEQVAGGAEKVRDLLPRIYRRRARFAACAGFHMAVWIYGLAEVALILWLLDLSLGVTEIWIFEAIGQMARNVGFFLPAALGAQEGGYALAAGIVGLGSGVGLGVSLIDRVRDVLAGLPPLLMWQGSALKERLSRRG